MTQFAKQKTQIELLNSRYKQYWQKELGARDADYISNPENFIEGVYFHQTNSHEDKLAILKLGFDKGLVAEENRGMGLGAGLYMGRDKRVLINFYDSNYFSLPTIPNLIPEYFHTNSIADHKNHSMNDSCFCFQLLAFGFQARYASHNDTPPCLQNSPHTIPLKILSSLQTIPLTNCTIFTLALFKGKGRVRVLYKRGISFLHPKTPRSTSGG